MIELIREYVEKFKEPVPIYQMPPMTDDELREVLKKAIEDNEPIKVETDPDLIY